MMRWVFLAIASLIVAANLWIVHEVHEGHRRELDKCYEVLKRELRYKPWATQLVLPADPCDAIRTVRMGR